MYFVVLYLMHRVNNACISGYVVVNEINVSFEWSLVN